MNKITHTMKIIKIVQLSVCFCWILSGFANEAGIHTSTPIENKKDATHERVENKASETSMFSGERITVRVDDTEGNFATTSIAYEPFCTAGLDIGLDAGSLTAGDLLLNTRLPNDTDGTDFQTNCLLDGNLERVAVPLSVIALANVTITFSATITGLTKDVYIEDRENKTFHKISGGSTFDVMTDGSGLDVADRFYLHVADHFWLGTTDTDWNTGSNWDTGVVPPTDSDGVLIMNATNMLVVANIDLTNLTIASGAGLTVNGNFDVSGTVTINSDLGLSGSLIVNDNSPIGTIEYKRYVSYGATNATGWHLIGAPVTGETIEDFISNGSLATGSDNIRKGFATYNNNSGSWAYMDNTTTGNIGSGTGYSVKRSIEGWVSFTGALQTADVNHPISIGTDNFWNLISNPFTSYLNINDGAGGFLQVNTDKFDPAALAAYVWDSAANGGAGGYVVINFLSGPTYVAPGQAFFVSSNGGGSVSIAESIQAHQPDHLFARGTMPELTLKVSADNSTKKTAIKYMSATTTGLDPGYDASIITANSSDFSVYSHLVSDNEGKNFMLQALSDIQEERSIPIGIDMPASDVKMTFAIDAKNIPNDMYVYLEDREKSIFTRFDAGTKYTVSSGSGMQGTGRFYIHTSKNPALNSDNIDVKPVVNIYKTDSSNIRVTGLEKGAAHFELVDMLGNKVFESSFNVESVYANDVSLPELRTGIYIAVIKNGKERHTKKVIL